MQFLIEIEPAAYSAQPEFLRGELEAFAASLAKFYGRPAVPRVSCELMTEEVCVVKKDALLKLASNVNLDGVSCRDAWDLGVAVGDVLKPK